MKSEFLSSMLIIILGASLSDKPRALVQKQPTLSLESCILDNSKPALLSIEYCF